MIVERACLMKLPEMFGTMVFNENAMQERLPRDVFLSLKNTIEDGKPLDISLANVVANAMKDWAVEKGATHYTHWFQPMTGVTAEKHDSFIVPDKQGGIIMEFSGKELIKGEPDASSFPSGGIRATFEARGYTAWDPTSYAFIYETTLYIPTAFCSYGGEALDRKTPLLRSMNALSKQSVRILRLFGKDTKRVITTVGPEQEYFLIDREQYNKRKDLQFTGRTLFGAKPPKGQELDDHYFGSLKLRVSEYMQDLDQELWKLGIPSKTRHNEVAPAQHELACFFSSANLATDQNQLVMSIMRKVAKKHGLTCLLHEKPFDGINGSGKHNNWAIATDDGVNLLDPGSSPEENAQFLLFLCAVIKAIDTHQDLMRLAVASSGNDHRLGSHEAPPAIISVFIGEELEAILKSIETGKPYDKMNNGEINIGVDVLPSFPKDSTDRNRTSPFAFTGNKFEFRMLGSSSSLAGPNSTLNTIVADALCEFADTLENAQNFNTELNTLIRDTIKRHKRILFNGNGYSDQWVKEAERRGLLNLKDSVEAIPYIINDENIRLYEKHGTFTGTELRSRYEVRLESYIKTLRIEANTMIEMVKTSYLPAVIRYGRELAEARLSKKAAFPEFECRAESELLRRIAGLTDLAFERNERLVEVVAKADGMLGNTELLKIAAYYRDTVITSMEFLRESVDELETMVSKEYWPYPSYGRLLYRL